VTYSDPHVPTLRLDGLELAANSEDATSEADCVAIVTDHGDFDYRNLVERLRLIVDTRNALRVMLSESCGFRLPALISQRIASKVLLFDLLNAVQIC
jgi:UDP-N-acetyl-D-mannosaminuronate dehydrogenase